MIYVMNYADGQPYEKFRSYNSISAKWIGKADHIFEFGPKDIDSEFKKKHQTIFNYKRGAGLWLWKPYLIKKALGMIKDDDWLFYADTGSVFVGKIQYLIDVAMRDCQEFLIFEIPMLDREFTKRESYKLMKLEEHGENQILSGFILLKKGKESERLLDEWIYYNSIEEIVSPTHFYNNIKDYPNFFAHREDQSVLSLLRIKNSYNCYRDPSDYGEMPFMYNYGPWTYHPLNYTNSTFPTIVISNRKEDPIKYTIKYFIKKLLFSVGIYGENYYKKK